MNDQAVLDVVAGKWWIFPVRGAIAILFGLMALTWPRITLLALVILYGAYALADGILAILSAFRGSGGTRWPVLAWGVLGVLAGIIVFVWPAITALVLVYLIAFWAVFTGVAEIATAIALRKVIAGEWALGLAGVLSVLVGLAMAVFPGAGALSITWLIGAYSIVLGAMLVVVGFRLRGLRGLSQATA